MAAAAGVEIRPVECRRDTAAFVRVPWRVYNGDPNWVPPLVAERRRHFSAANPYFAHADVRFFLALRGDTPVGRISAQIDRLAQPAGGPMTGHFGLLEACDREVLHTLLRAAEGWLAQQGAAAVEGPYSLSINDEAGLLVEGVDGPPRLLMNHAPVWYGEAVVEAGYAGVQDLLAYGIDVARPLHRRAARMAELTARESDVRERPLDPGDLVAEMRRVIAIFNDAWADNWGFVPMTEAEIGYMTRNLRPLLEPRLVRFAEVGGEAAAMLVALPDLNSALAGLNGRLLPFGWARLLWRLKVRRPRHGRVLMMGVRRAHRERHLSAGLVALMVQRLHEGAGTLGMRELELSWVLEGNMPMRRLLDMIGAQPVKRYRLYRKALG